MRPNETQTANEVKVTTSDDEEVFFTGAELKQIQDDEFLTIDDVATYRIENDVVDVEGSSDE